MTLTIYPPFRRCARLCSRHATGRCRRLSGGDDNDMSYRQDIVSLSGRQEGRMAGPSAHSRQLAQLFDETVRLYLRLSALSTRIHGGGQLSGPRRTVLVGLARSGAQTVAQMARARAQSRQRFQPLVNALLRDRLVRAVPNAAHKQSPLIELTPRGRREVARIHAVESR